MAGPADCATSSSSTGANPFDARRSRSPVERSSVDDSIPAARATDPRPKGFDPGCADAALAGGEGAPRVGVAGPGSPTQGRGGTTAITKTRSSIKRKRDTGAGAYQGRSRQGVHDPDRLLPPFILSYKVYRCWVSEYQALPDLDAHADAVAIESIKLENEGWERDHDVVEPQETT